MEYRRMAYYRTAQQLRDYLAQTGIDLQFDDTLQVGENAPLAQPYRLQDGFVIGNRFCIHPMEGWDGLPDGKPSELTIRRWERFGLSGAKLIWGGEAVAVRHEGRANPNQLLLNEKNLKSLASLRQRLVDTHAKTFGDTKDLLVGLQLTHSGRFCRPNSNKLEPKILYHHPYLDQRFKIPEDYPVLTDAEIESIIQDFIRTAGMAKSIGFDFVDVKHCHGYLGHEFLSAYTRPGPYGGSFENRTRFLREVTQGIRQHVPGLRIGVRLSAFDTVPFVMGEDQKGIPVTTENYPWGFGLDPHNPLQYHLDEPVQFLELLQKLEIELVNITGGSPYYDPHIQRPAMFPPSDGYRPPEDPLVGVARQINVTAQLKQHFPKLLLVGSAYTYLQEWLPNVAQYYVRQGLVDFAGLGRMVLSYPELPADVLAGRPLNKRLVCRTFSDCTTAPRNGMVSGCYPLDELYKERPDVQMLQKYRTY